MVLSVMSSRVFYVVQLLVYHRQVTLKSTVVFVLVFNVTLYSEVREIRIDIGKVLYPGPWWN